MSQQSPAILHSLGPDGGNAICSFGEKAEPPPSPRQACEAQAAGNGFQE